MPAKHIVPRNWYADRNRITPPYITLGGLMCQYCHCVTRIEDAFIGDRIGGIEKPLYIAKLDNPIDNYLF